MSKKVDCPECHQLVNIPDDALVGDIIICHGEDDSCLAELEIISLDPPLVSLLVEEK